MYDNCIHDYDRVLNEVVEPILSEVFGVYEDSHDHYSSKIFVNELDGFALDAPIRKSSGRLSISKCLENHGVGVQRLAKDVYFVRKLPRKRSSWFLGSVENLFLYNASS